MAQKINGRKGILAAFAFFYAQKNYVKGNINTTAELMQVVKQSKGWAMNTGELKLWILSALLPYWLLMRLKKIKQTI